MLDILPCPNCNSQADLFSNGDSSYVVCNKCKMRGPSNKAEYAIHDWNYALQRKLNWTDIPPTQNGSYWFLPPDEEPLVLEIENGMVRDGRLLISTLSLQGKWSDSPIPLPKKIP